MAIIFIGTAEVPIFGSDVIDDPGAPDPPGVLSANSYLSSGLGYATWAAADSNTRKRALVTAARYLDTLRWAGTKVSSTQALSWPRTGVTLPDGTAVDSTVYPLAVVYAEYELALALLTNPTLITDTAAGGQGNIKKVKAGSAEVEYFKSTALTVLPMTILMGLYGYLLSGTSASSYAVVSGVTTESIFDEFRAYDIEGT